MHVTELTKMVLELFKAEVGSLNANHISVLTTVL